MCDLIKSKQIYSPQNYLELITGKCYILNDDEDDVESILQIIAEQEYDLHLKVYDLDEIDKIIANKTPVVLVDCCYFDSGCYNLQHRYVWLEVTKEAIEEINNN